LPNGSHETELNPIYLDNNATTAPAPDVLEAMQAAASISYGNPSSIHRIGRAARALLDRAHEQAGEALGAPGEAVLFCSGGSEADALAILGTVQAAPPTRRHLVVSAIEHPAVLKAAEAASRHFGASLSLVAPDQEGIVATESIEAALREDTLLVSLMLANNETGALQPVAKTAQLCHDRGVLIHSDAVQAVGKVPVDFGELGVDLLSISAHKFHGPRGCGLLLRRRGTPMQPLIRGGGQEQGLRPGTENLAGILGLCHALSIVKKDLIDLDPSQPGPETTTSMRGLTEALLARLYAALPNLCLNGPADYEKRLPNTLNLSFPGIEAEPLLMGLDRLGVCVSTGSACASGSVEPSHVLRAMKLSPERLHASLRISISRYTNAEELQIAGDAIIETVNRLS